MKPYWKAWGKAAGIRALRTMAQTAVALIPIGVTVSDVGWFPVLGTAILAGIVSLLTSVAGLPEIRSETESKNTSYDEEDGI